MVIVQQLQPSGK